VRGSRYGDSHFEGPGALVQTDLKDVTTLANRSIPLCPVLTYRKLLRRPPLPRLPGGVRSRKDHHPPLCHNAPPFPRRQDGFVVTPARPVHVLAAPAFVVGVLEDRFKMTREQATEAMLATHRRGTYVVATMEKVDAEEAAASFMRGLASLDTRSDALWRRSRLARAPKPVRSASSRLRQRSRPSA
jgi:ATP-dependent Clp protease adaptor protein ClpS